MPSACLPKRGHAIHEPAAQKCKLRTAGEHPRDVGAGTDSAVEQDLDLSGKPSDDRHEGMDRRLARVELATAVVRNDDAIEPEPDGHFGILLGGHPLEHEFSLPAVADRGEHLRREPSGKRLVHEQAQMLHVEVCRHVFLQRGKHGLAMTQRLHGPRGTARHLQHAPHADRRRHRQPVADVVVAEAKRGDVGQDHQDPTAGRRGTVEHVVPHDGIDRIVELKPEIAPGDRADALDARGAARAEDEGEVVVHGGLGEHLRSARPDQPLQADRRHTEGGVVHAAKQLGLERRLAMLPQIRRPQFHVADLVGVFPQVDVLVAAAVKKFKDEPGHALPGAGPQVVDRRIAGVVGNVHVEPLS